MDPSDDIDIDRENENLYRKCSPAKPETLSKTKTARSKSQIPRKPRSKPENQHVVLKTILNPAKEIFTTCQQLRMAEKDEGSLGHGEEGPTDIKKEPSQDDTRDGETLLKEAVENSRNGRDLYNNVVKLPLVNARYGRSFVMNRILRELRDIHAADGRIDIALRNLRELRDLPMRQGGFGIVRHSGVFGDAAVASSRAFAVRFLGKVHFGDFIRERAQSKWLGEDTRILIGGSRRRQLFEKATDDLFFVPATSTMSLDDRLACLIDAAVGTILDVSDPLDPWVSRQQVDTIIIPPVTMQVIPGTDVNDASIPIIERNPNHHDDGEEDLYEGCTRRSSYAIALSDTHRRVLRLADESFIDASDPVCREEVRLLCEKVHDARARAFHERLLDSSRYQQALWFACSRFRGSGAFLMGASQALYGLADFYGHPQEWREAACARLLLPPVPPINGSYIRRCQCGHDIDFQIDCFHWHQCSASNRSIFQTRHAMVKRALLRALKSHVVSERVESVQDEPLLPHRRESPPATAAGSGTHGV
eukprot:gene24389-29484_t